MTPEEKVIEGVFTYHKPHGRQMAIYEELREKTKVLALYTMRHCPKNVDRTQAIKKLREFVMWANSSIANEEVFQL